MIEAIWIALGAYMFLSGIFSFFFISVPFLGQLTFPIDDADVGAIILLFLMGAWAYCGFCLLSPYWPTIRAFLQSSNYLTNGGELCRMLTK